MRAYQIGNFGLDALHTIQRDIPQPAPGQVLLRIHAVSLNYRDLLVVQGVYNPRMALPRIPCSDAAAEVVAIGSGVTRVAPGDRVCTLFFQRWLSGPTTAANLQHALGGDVDGVLAEYLTLPEDGVIPFPQHLSYEEAATLPCAALTAWNALHHAGSPPSPADPAHTVLIQGTGGVALFALQFAKLLGCRVFGISSSDEKLAQAAALGLDEALNYRTHPDWPRWIADITERRGVDRIIEVGGAGTFAHSLKAAAPNALIAQIGVLSGGATTESIPLTAILHKQLRIQGIYVGSREMFAEMNQAIAGARLRPVIDRVFPFADARAALQTMQSGAHIGKLVIRVSEAG